MALTKAKVAVLSVTTGAAGSTKASPGASSSWIDVRSYYGGVLCWRMKNTASAPTAAPALLVQVSSDAGTTTADITDYALVGGDLTASSDNSGVIALDRNVMYMRVLGYGNATNTVDFSAHLEATSALA